MLFAAPAVSHGHAHLTQPAPRDPDPAIKDPYGPCGQLPRTNTPVMYKTGQTVTLNWVETVYHPGCYLIDFSPANDLNWQTLATLPHDAKTATPINYTGQVTLPPGVTCPSCTLRVRQIMLNAPGACPPSPILTGQTYYSCVDIAITNGPASPDMASPTTPDLATASPDAAGGGGAVATGCHAVPAKATAGSLWGLGLLGLLALRLRRRHPV